LKEGDANTRFFHMHACFRKKRNFISHLEDEDRIVTNHDQMQELLDSFFSDLLGTEIQRPFTLNLPNCHRDPVDLSDLESPFSKREVQNMIASLPNDIAPGPDGFTGRFYKSSWHIIKTDIMVALESLRFGNAHSLGLLNSAYLVLIPKKVDALSARDFWPFSLIHSFAKLVTKLLANRLGPHLQKLVAANQSAFVKEDRFMIIT
jgi:hypothetical protein